MAPCREIIELRSIGLSLDKVAYLTGTYPQKVSRICKRAADLGLQWPVPSELSDEELHQMVDPTHHTQLSQHDDAKRPCMLVNWTVAEVAQIDWAGHQIPIYGKEGDVTPAYLFVAALPYSDYTFVRASLDMSMLSWLEHHRAMFDFLGGVPLFLSPDNCATAVTFDRKKAVGEEDYRKVNRRYQDLADHYNVIVTPTRTHSPQDKAAVEQAVNNAANRFAGVLSQMRFTSIDQLNETIAALTSVFNDRPMMTIRSRRSRREIFLQEEAPHLAPLPTAPYEGVVWTKAKTNSDAAVRVRGVWYGLPEGCADMDAAVRIDSTTIEVYTADRAQLLARHLRREDGSDTFEGFAGRRPDRYKSLAEWAEQNKRLLLIQQWHPTKNGCGPDSVVCKSRHRAWWLCPDCGYEWSEPPRARTDRKWDDCLACAGVDLVPGRNDLATLHPEIAAEWHPTKNGCNPEDVFPSHSFGVWWKGAKCDHEWFCPPARRAESAYGALCPFCSGQKGLAGFNDVASLVPELVKLWDKTKNRRERPENTPVYSQRKVYLTDGPLGNCWLESPRSWLERNGLNHVLEPFDRVVADAKEQDARNTIHSVSDPNAHGKALTRGTRHALAQKNPCSFEEWCANFHREDLLGEWHPAKNVGLTTRDVASGASTNAWWLCAKCGCEWQALVRKRQEGGVGCPVCNPSHKIIPGVNDLTARGLHFIKLYSPDNELPPERVSDRSEEMLKWRCPSCGHKWKCTLDEFPGGWALCPKCDSWDPNKNRRLTPGVNDLAARFPITASFWHPQKNNSTRPQDVTPNSPDEAWWLCPKCGYEWKERIVTVRRRRSNACPKCADHAPRGRAVKRGFLANERPDIAKEWHPTKNGKYTPSNVTAGSSMMAWWVCENGHEWEARVKDRTVVGAKCYYCQNRRALAGFNDLASQKPELAAQWHPILNGNLKPADILAGSTHDIWWQCAECGHEWSRSPSKRRSKAGQACPNCDCLPKKSDAELWLRVAQYRTRNRVSQVDCQ